MKERDLSKLPRWAQEEIQVLRHNNAALRQELANVCGEEPTTAYWETYGMTDPTGRKMYLPAGRVVFDLGKDKFGVQHTMRLDVSRTLDGVVGVWVNASGGHLRVVPQSSNVLSFTSLHPNGTS